jgi:hypothetical protein
MPEDGNSTQLEAKLEKFMQPRSGHLLDYVPLKTGDQVTLLMPDVSSELDAYFRSSNRFYIRPKDEDNEVRRVEIADMVTFKVSKSKHYS